MRIMVKYIPPTDFFRYSEKKKSVNISEVRARLVENIDLGKTFLLLRLNNPATITSLTRDLESVFERCYRQKVFRLVKDLVKLGVVDFRKVEDIDKENPEDVEKDILRKHNLFLTRIENPWNNVYGNSTYYFISDIGKEVFDFVAMKYNFTIIQDEEKNRDEVTNDREKETTD